MVAGGAALTLSWRGSVGLLLLGVAALAPMTLTTSTDAERSHDILGDAMTLHGLAAALWLGSGVAVALHVGQRRGRCADRAAPPRRPGHRLPAARRGVRRGRRIGADRTARPLRQRLRAARRRRASRWRAAAAAAAAHRMRVRVRTGGPRTALGVLAVEATVLAVASVSGTALVRVFPPDRATYTTTRMVYLIGYELPPHLTAADLALFWRWDVLFGTVAVLAAAGYLLGARRLRRAGAPWPAAWTRVLAGGLRRAAPGDQLRRRRGRARGVQRAHGPAHADRDARAGAPAARPRGEARAARHRAHGQDPRARPARQPGRAVRRAARPRRGRRWRSPSSASTPPACTRRSCRSTGRTSAWTSRSSAPGLALYWPVLGHHLPGQGLPPVGRIVMVFAVMDLHAAFAAWLLSRSGTDRGAVLRVDAAALRARPARRPAPWRPAGMGERCGPVLVAVAVLAAVDPGDHADDAVRLAP